MAWYYLDEAQKQAGPVDEAAFQALVAAGKITAHTRVWKEGMPEWRLYGTLAGDAGQTVVCSVSGQAVPRDQAVEIAGRWVSQEHKAEFLQKLKEGAPLPGARHYGGFWIRFGAKFIDGLILLIPGLAVQALLPLVGLRMVNDPHNPLANIGVLAATFTLSFMIRLAYNVFFVGRYGATPGKMACGLKVIRADGQPVSYALATGRYFGELLSSLILCIGYLMVAFDEEKRALHDRLCNTRVVYKD